VIPWISLAYFIGGFKIFLQASASIVDRTDLFIKTGIYTIISNILLNYILIKHFGIQGAVASTILSYSILIILLFFSSKRVIKIKWPIKKIIHGASIASFLIIVFDIIKKIDLDYEIAIKVFLLILFPIISVLTNLIGNKELNGLRSLWGSIVKKI
jgi:O-antigen/teichoic acid export membrane protein